MANSNFYRLATVGDSLPDYAYVSVVMVSGSGTVVFEDGAANELFEVRSTGPTVTVEIGCISVVGFQVKSIDSGVVADIVVK